MKARLFSLFILSIFLTSCATGSTLRTARILDPGEFEFSGGVTGVVEFPTAQSVFAVGVAPNLELELRGEFDYLSLSPRIQILKAEKHGLDFLSFGEIGQQEKGRFIYGGGAILGRRFAVLEPYVSYRYRHFETVEETKVDGFFAELFHFDSYRPKELHYLNAGTRFHFFKSYFVGVEAGVLKSSQDTLFQWGINFGRTF